MICVLALQSTGDQSMSIKEGSEVRLRIMGTKMDQSDIVSVPVGAARAPACRACRAACLRWLRGPRLIADR